MKKFYGFDNLKIKTFEHQKYYNENWKVNNKWENNLQFYKIESVNLLNIKTFHLSEQNDTPQIGENFCKVYIEKGLVSKMHKKLLKLNNNNNRI